MSTPTFSPIRQAGRFEAFHIVRNALGIYTSVMVGAKYHSSSGKLDKNTLYPALQRVIRRVSALRISIVGARSPIQTASYPAFVSCEVDERVLDKICVFRDDVRWDDEDATGLARFIEAEMVVGYDTDDISIPLWRVAVCGGDTVLFFYHHAIADGKSGVAFHAMLLEALNSSDATPDPPPHQFTPSVEDLVDVRPSIGKVLKAIFGHYFIPTPWTNAPVTWTGNPTPSPSAEYNEAPKDKVTSFGIKPRIRNELFELSAAEADRLLLVCRKHNASITSALYTMVVAVASQIVMKDINTAPNTPFSRLNSHIPLSLRPLSGVPEVAFCDHASTWNNSTPLRPEFRWEDARTHAAALKSSLKEGKAEQEIGLLWLLFGRYVDFFKGDLGKKRGSTFEISNLGRFPSVDIGDDTRWRIGKTVFTQGGGISGPAFGLNVVGHGDGGITVTMCWSSYTIDEELALKILRSVRGELKSLVDSDSFA